MKITIEDLQLVEEALSEPCVMMAFSIDSVQLLLQTGSVQAQLKPQMEHKRKNTKLWRNCVLSGVWTECVLSGGSVCPPPTHIPAKKVPGLHR
jgi:hypothetical protein